MNLARVAAAMGVLAACAMPARAAEPPDWPGLACRVVAQSAATALRLQVRFDNGGPAPIELPPGPHLVLYADPAADDALETTARLDRVQRTPIVVPAAGSRSEVFVLDAAVAERLRCPPRVPAAAAIYFYRFSPRPQSRCRLEGYDAAGWAASSPCPTAPR